MKIQLLTLTLFATLTAQAGQLFDGTETLLAIQTQNDFDPQQDCIDLGYLYIEDFSRSLSHTEIVGYCSTRANTQAFAHLDCSNNYCRPFKTGGGFSICYEERTQFDRTSSYCPVLNAGGGQNSQASWEAQINTDGNKNCSTKWNSINGLAVGLGVNRTMTYRDIQGRATARTQIVGSTECALLRSMPGSTVNQTVSIEKNSCIANIVKAQRAYNDSYALNCQERSVSGQLRDIMYP